MDYKQMIRLKQIPKSHRLLVNRERQDLSENGELSRCQLLETQQTEHAPTYTDLDSFGVAVPVKLMRGTDYRSSYKNLLETPSAGSQTDEHFQNVSSRCLDSQFLTHSSRVAYGALEEQATKYEQQKVGAHFQQHFTEVSKLILSDEKTFGFTFNIVIYYFNQGFFKLIRSFKL